MLAKRCLALPRLLVGTLMQIKLEESVQQMTVALYAPRRPKILELSHTVWVQYLKNWALHGRIIEDNL